MMNSKNKKMKTLNRPGHDRLWQGFGLSYASWLTLPRVLMHEMPDEWQMKMAELIEEYDEFWDFYTVDYESSVSLKQDGKFVKIPNWIINYRYPDWKIIDKLKKKK